ncbi:GNAT family N-acetyltransferase [Jiella sp. M17.18]|uniref:GNAT family N-acetyltransferase n=1 Tax=Jiella sp. M17.18 TaxID=3234247 RepID=UPI0034E04B3A
MGDFRSLGLFAPEPLTDGHDFRDFSCGKPSLDTWLTDMALHNQAANYTRTFVVRTKDMKVTAYYALCAGMILRKDAPKTVSAHGAPGEIPIALLARFAVHRDLQGRGIGKALLAHALRTAASAAQAVAFRALVVDAIDEEAAAFYRKLGFQPTKISPMKLILPMQDVMAAMFPDEG